MPMHPTTPRLAQAPYAQRVHIPGAPSIHDLPDPPGYEPVHMYLLARHGTRWPTRKRARQMTNLEPVLRVRAAMGRGCPPRTSSTCAAVWWDNRGGGGGCSEGSFCLASCPLALPPALTPVNPSTQGATSPDHAWAANWTSPFKRLPYVHGDLHPVGEARTCSPPAAPLHTRHKPPALHSPPPTHKHSRAAHAAFAAQARTR